MYPANTEAVYSYFESRTGAMYPSVVWFGLQALLKQIEGVCVTQSDIEEAAMVCRAHFGNDTSFNRAGWEYIVNQHKGRLPVRIKAVPEGTVIPVSNILMSVESTDPKCAWLTNYIESFLTHIWYPCTVATQSRACKLLLSYFIHKTSDNPGAVSFMLHDFGYRGVSSDQSADIGGAAHLVNFLGTDTIEALPFIVKYYKGLLEGLAYSVAATEHSIMSALGPEGEADIIQDLLNKYPKGILSVVADTYDIYNFCDNLMGKKFKDQILAREGVFVVRPDSVTPEHPYPEAEIAWILESLWKNFGGTVNSKGYKVLNSKVKVLWGDGLDMEDITQIVKEVTEDGYSVENLVFGMGGGLLQKVNRDTQRFAFKSSAQKRDGVWHDVYKKPKDLSKISKKGRMKLVRKEGSHASILVTVPESDPRPDFLEVVFENGEIKKTYNFTTVRANANIHPWEIANYTLPVANDNLI